MDDGSGYPAEVYLRDVRLLVDEALDVEGHLLRGDERAALRAFRLLTDDAKVLAARLYNRKKGWVRFASCRGYPVGDLAAAARELAARGMADVVFPTDLYEGGGGGAAPDAAASVLTVLSVAELRDVLKAAALPCDGEKAVLSGRLSRVLAGQPINGQARLSFVKGPTQATGRAVAAVLGAAGECVRLTPAFLGPYALAQRLFVLQTPGDYLQVVCEPGSGKGKGKGKAGKGAKGAGPEKDSKGAKGGAVAAPKMLPQMPPLVHPPTVLFTAVRKWPTDARARRKPRSVFAARAAFDAYETALNALAHVVRACEAGMVHKDKQRVLDEVRPFAEHAARMLGGDVVEPEQENAPAATPVPAREAPTPATSGRSRAPEVEVVDVDVQSSGGESGVVDLTCDSPRENVLVLEGSEDAASERGGRGAAEEAGAEAQEVAGGSGGGGGLSEDDSGSLFSFEGGGGSVDLLQGDEAAPAASGPAAAAAPCPGCRRVHNEDDSLVDRVFSADHVYRRLLLEALGAYEQGKQYAAAMAMGETALRCPRFNMRRRGKVWMRLVINAGHLKDAAKARAVCYAALASEENAFMAAGERLWLERRYAKLTAGDADAGAAPPPQPPNQAFATALTPPVVRVVVGRKWTGSRWPVWDLASCHDRTADLDAAAASSDAASPAAEGDGASGTAAAEPPAAAAAEDGEAGGGHGDGGPDGEAPWSQVAEGVADGSGLAAVQPPVRAEVAGKGVKGGRGQGNGKAKPPSLGRVEAAALAAICREEGEGWTGRHCEGGTLQMLFALLLWDVLFDAAHEHALPLRFMACPLDWGKPEFLQGARRAAVAAKVAAVAALTGEALAAAVTAAYSAHHGAVALACNWEIPCGTVVEVAACLGPARAAALCEEFATQFSMSGMPDLLLWNPLTRDVIASEVKGPGDTLSTKQEIWLTRLAALGIRCEVCRVMDDAMFAKAVEAKAKAARQAAGEEPAPPPKRRKSKREGGADAAAPAKRQKKAKADAPVPKRRRKGAQQPDAIDLR